MMSCSSRAATSPNCSTSAQESRRCSPGSTAGCVFLLPLSSSPPFRLLRSHHAPCVRACACAADPGARAWVHTPQGVGCVAVHPSREYFAVGEKGTNPNVYIYDYPALRLYKILRSGTERAFTAAAFSQDGRQLATARRATSSHPDASPSLVHTRRTPSHPRRTLCVLSADFYPAALRISRLAGFRTFGSRCGTGRPRGPFSAPRRSARR